MEDLIVEVCGSCIGCDNLNYTGPTINTCVEGNDICEKCNNACIIVEGINFSSKAMQIKKHNRVANILLEISPFISSRATVSGFPFKLYLKTPTEEIYTKWFNQMKNSVLSLTEQKNLLQNTATQLVTYNNLSLIYCTKAILLQYLGEVKMLTVTDANIQQTTEMYLSNIVYNFILNASYGSETMTYKYNEMFNLLFRFVSAALNIRYNSIISQIFFKFRNIYN